MGDPGSVGVQRVDQDIALHPRGHGRHDQYGAAPLRIPCLPERLAQSLILSVPSRMRGGLEYFIADAVGDGDADMMLVGWQHAARMDQLFQHRRRIMFRRVDDGAGGRVPPPRIQPRPFAVIDGMDAIGIADAIGRQNPVGFPARHTPPP